MKKTMTLVGAALATVLSAGATAAPLVGPGLVERVTGSEFRGFYRSQRGQEDVIWRFAPDGTLTGYFIALRHAGPSLVREEVGDSGRWYVEGDRLCVHWRTQMYGRPNCFTVDTRQGTHVRLLGGIGITVVDGQITR